jgi:hypothetical protein
MSGNSNNEKEATNELRRRLEALQNNNSNVPFIPVNKARELALLKNEQYRVITRAPSRSSSRAPSPSRSRASSPARSQTPGRRTRAELINKYRRNVENFRTRRQSGTLGKSRTRTNNQREAILVAKLNAAIAANALSRAKSTARNELKRAQSVARNETKRAQSAARERAAAELATKRAAEKAKIAANKAAGIVVPKAPKPSANEQLASIRAKAEANARAIRLKAEATARAIETEVQVKVAKLEERAARREELTRQLAALQAVKNQERAKAAAMKAAKERADLEAKCAALGWTKNREARGE